MSEITAYVCEHVFDGSRPVSLVAHEGGDWQFLCGGSHPVTDIPRVIGRNHLVDGDPTLKDVLDLPMDWEAEREDVGSAWIRTKLVADQ